MVIYCSFLIIIDVKLNFQWKYKAKGFLGEKGKRNKQLVFAMIQKQLL